MLAATCDLCTPRGSPIKLTCQMGTTLTASDTRGLFAVTTPSARIRSCINQTAGFCFVFERFPRSLTHNHAISHAMRPTHRSEHYFSHCRRSRTGFHEGLFWVLCILNLVNPTDRGRSTAACVPSNTHQPPDGEPDVRSKLQLFEYQPLSTLERWQARRKGFAQLPPPASSEVPDAFLQIPLSRRKRCDDKDNGDTDPS